MQKYCKSMFITLIAVLVFVITGPMPTQAKTVSLSKSSLTLVKGTTYHLKVKNGTPKNYSSSQKKIATVSKKGKISARKKGSATIKVKVGKKTLTCRVKVIDGKLNKKKIRLTAGDKTDLIYTGTAIAQKCVIADSSIASVSSTGNNHFSITANKAGATRARVYIKDSVLTCKITVLATANPEYAWVKKGQVKNVPEPQVGGVYSQTYSADISSVILREEFQGADRSGNRVSSTYTTKCSSPLDTLKAGDTLSLTVSMNMSNKTKDVGEPYRIYVSWNGCRLGSVDSHSYDYFTSSENMYLNCSANEDFPLNLTATASYTVPRGNSVGDQSAVVFSQFGGAYIAWIYEWKQIN